MVEIIITLHSHLLSTQMREKLVSATMNDRNIKSPGSLTIHMNVCLFVIGLKLSFSKEDNIT